MKQITLDLIKHLARKAVVRKELKEQEQNLSRRISALLQEIQKDLEITYAKPVAVQVGEHVITFHKLGPDRITFNITELIKQDE